MKPEHNNNQTQLQDAIYISTLFPLLCIYYLTVIRSTVVHNGMELGLYMAIWHLVLTSVHSSDVFSKTFCKEKTVGCSRFIIICQEGVIAIGEVLYTQDQYCHKLTELRQRHKCCCVDHLANDTSPVDFAAEAIISTCHGQSSCNVGNFLTKNSGRITIEYTCNSTALHSKWIPTESSTQSTTIPETPDRTSDHDDAVLPVLMTLLLICLISLSVAAVIYFKRRKEIKFGRHDDVRTVENPHYDTEEFATGIDTENLTQSALDECNHDTVDSDLESGPCKDEYSWVNRPKLAIRHSETTERSPSMAVVSKTTRNCSEEPFSSDAQFSMSGYDHTRWRHKTTTGDATADKPIHIETSDETARVSAYDSVVHFQRSCTEENELFDNTYNTTRELKNSRRTNGDTYDRLAPVSTSGQN